MGQEHVRVRGGGRAYRGVAVVTRDRLPVGWQEVLLSGGEGRAHRGAEMVAHKRMSVGHFDTRTCGEPRARRERLGGTRTCDAYL